jgi:1-pyrroline-5-carboxylate dehydrogenase
MPRPKADEGISHTITEVKKVSLMSNAVYHPPLPINETILNYAPGSSEKQSLKAELSRQKQSPREISLVIDGQRLGAKPSKTIASPHNHQQILARYPEASAADVDLAIDAALRARETWAELPWEERAGVFLRAADLLATKYRSAINAATMLGQSKTCYQAEIDAACELIDFLRFNVYFARKIYEEQPLYSPRGTWNRSEARPLEGFVYAIAPFNFTAISLNLACAPALMGCTVVWKPAHSALLSSALGLDILMEAGLPPGVINLVAGDAPMITARALAHRQLAGIHFTGSTAVFQQLWKTVGNNLSTYASYPRLVGETGGKDFVFAHPTADAQTLTTALIRGSFEYQGQKCSAASRAYIPASLWKKIQGPLVDQCQSLTMGDPEDFTNFMGAVIDERAFTRITRYIDQAAAAGSSAKVLCGGERQQDQGYFIRPTIIQALDPHYTTMVEEIFGPVLTVYVYAGQDLEGALKLCASSSPYALTGAIFAQDRHAVHHLTRALVNAAGNFYINDKPTGAVVGQQPFGGARASGTNDKAGSVLNLWRWVSPRSIKENFIPPSDHRYAHMDES